MKGIATCILCLAFLASGVLAEPAIRPFSPVTMEKGVAVPDPQPLAVDPNEFPEIQDGGFAIHRVQNAPRFSFEIGVVQAPKDFGKIEAVKIYSMPSRTFIAAVVENDLDPRVFLAVWGMFEGFPMATSTAPFDGSIIRVGMDEPPLSDTSLRVDYVVLKNGEYRTQTVALSHFANLDAFELTANPVLTADRGTGYRFCGSCGGQFCGCINCPSVEYTLCCPGCEQNCGYIFCP